MCRSVCCEACKAVCDKEWVLFFGESGLMMAPQSGDSTNAAPKLKTTACVGLVGDAAWSEARSWRRCVVWDCCYFAAVHDVSVVALAAVVYVVQLAMAMVAVAVAQLHLW